MGGRTERDCRHSRLKRFLARARAVQVGIGQPHHGRRKMRHPAGGTDRPLGTLDSLGLQTWLGAEMKKLMLWMMVLAIASVRVLHAQEMAGAWQGTLQPPAGPALRIVMQLSRAADQSWQARMYSIDQGGQPINATLTVQGSVVKIAVHIDAAERPFNRVNHAVLIAIQLLEMIMSEFRRLRATYGAGVGVRARVIAL